MGPICWLRTSKPDVISRSPASSFGVNIQDDDTSKTTTQTGKNEPKKQKFSSWISNGAAAKTYPVELDEFEFERTMDKASPLLFQACVNKETLPSIVLIKRKDIGSRAGRDAYLRLEFSEVLMISIDWNTAPQVKEKCKFIARKVQIQYRPQAHAGALGKVIPAEFSYTFTKTG